LGKKEKLIFREYEEDVERKKRQKKIATLKGGKLGAIPGYVKTKSGAPTSIGGTTRYDDDNKDIKTIDEGGEDDDLPEEDEEEDDSDAEKSEIDIKIGRPPWFKFLPSEEEIYKLIKRGVTLKSSDELYYT
jgi:hypothetical protein